MLGISSIDDGDFSGRRVLLRVDINSPIDRTSGDIVNDNRIVKSIPTITDLMDMGARLVIIAHQGDTTDYPSLVSLRNHAQRLSELLAESGKKIHFIEDITGPAAIEMIESLEDGKALLLDNLRYLTEEVSTFEDSVTQTAHEMQRCLLVRKLAHLFDAYVNDAFAAAHRNSPSMVGFQQLLPSYGGRLFLQELTALSSISENPEQPCIYMLGGSRAGDAFGMIEKVLVNDAAEHLLLSGLIGQIFMLADDINIGKSSTDFILAKGFGAYIDKAKQYLKSHRNKIEYPRDVAVKKDDMRFVLPPSEVADEMDICDIGDQTILDYQQLIAKSNTIFVNGPCGVYEDELFEVGTRELWKAVAQAQGFSVIGGGDSVTSFKKYTNIEDIGYVSTAGGALIRYLSGVHLPLIEAMKRAN